MGNAHGILEEHGYTLLEEIGQGAFGTAFRVKKTTDGKESVIKAVLKSEHVTHEVAALEALKHPFIVEYHESFEDMTNLYMAMEYCAGGDLSQKIQNMRASGDQFSYCEILDWCTEICMALHHLQEKNILHNDLKPQEERLKANFLTIHYYDATVHIYLDKYGRIRLGDFGLAKLIKGSSTYAHTNAGTYCYQSPERIDRKPWKSKSDMWGLGCILYELCELRPAFPEESLRDLMNTIVDGPYPSISGRYPTDLQDLVRDLLQKNPADRPSASDIMGRPFIVMILLKKIKGVPEQLQQKLAELNAVADGLERVLYGTTAGSLTGAVVGAAGGITTVVGLALIPFTLGVSGIVAGVGAVVAAAGGVTGAASHITNMVNERIDRPTIVAIISEIEAKMLSLLTCFQHIESGFENLEQNQLLSVGPAARALRGLGGLAKIASAVKAFRAASQAVRIGRVAEVLTGVFAGLFLFVDIYFIVDDSREIHAMRQEPPTAASEYGRLEVLDEPSDGGSTGSQASGADVPPEASGQPEERKALKTREFIQEIRKASAEIQRWLDEFMPLFSAGSQLESACMFT